MTDPYSPPAAASAPPIRSGPAKAPGIHRLAFVAWFFVIIVFGAFLNVITDSALGGIVAGLLLLVPASKRLANIGRHPMWCLLLLVPVIGLIVSLPCLILPESYQYHRKLDLAAKIWLGIILCPLALIAIAIFTNL